MYHHIYFHPEHLHFPEEQHTLGDAVNTEQQVKVSRLAYGALGMGSIALGGLVVGAVSAGAVAMMRWMF